MNIGYLLSILDLYLLKEKSGSLIIEVDNILDIVKVKFSYSFDSSNKTFVKIDKKMFFDNIYEFLSKIQGNLEIKNEVLIQDVKSREYKLTFDKNRNLSFINFSNKEIKLIRENLNEVKNDFTLEISDIESYDKKKEKIAKTKLSYSMGFTSYITLFITSIWFLDVLMISLWIFKVFIK